MCNNIVAGKGMAAQRKSMTLDRDIIRNVEELAKREGSSFSNMMQKILEEHSEIGTQIKHIRRTE